MIRTAGLSHIHLSVRDLDHSVRFYRQVFGMEPLFSRPGKVTLRTPGAADAVTLEQDATTPAVAGRSAGISHFGFRIKDPQRLDDAIRDVEAAAGTSSDEASTLPGTLSSTSPIQPGRSSNSEAP